MRCEYSASSPWLENPWVVPRHLKSDFPLYQRQTQELWESSDNWLAVVRLVRAIDRAATLCQQVFPLVWVRQAQELVLARKVLELGRELALGLVLELAQQARKEFQQQ